MPEYVIQNPGGYLGENTSATQASRLNTVFDTLIGTLWAGSGAPTLTIDTGGALGGDATHPTVPEDVFTSSVVTVNFPGSSFPVRAMKYIGTAASGNYVAYVFNPKDYETGCGNLSIPAPVLHRPVIDRLSGFRGCRRTWSAARGYL